MLERSLKLEQGSLIYTIDENVFVLLGQNENVNGKRHLDLSSKYMNVIQKQVFIAFYLCRIEMNEPYSFILVDGLEEYLGNLALYKLENNRIKLLDLSYDALYKGDKWRQLGLKINTEPIYVWLAKYNMINKNKINLQRW